MGFVVPQRGATSSANRPSVSHPPNGSPRAFAGEVDWNDPSRTDVIAKRSGVCAAGPSFSGSEHEDTEADLRVQFDTPDDDPTVRVSPELTDALLGLRARRATADEHTIVDGWANRVEGQPSRPGVPAKRLEAPVNRQEPPASQPKGTALLRTGRRPIALPRRPEPPPAAHIASFPPAPRLPSEFASTRHPTHRSIAAPLPTRSQRAKPLRLNAKFLVSGAFLIVASFVIARGASDRQVRARAVDTFEELRQAWTDRFQAPATQAPATQAPATQAPARTSQSAPGADAAPEAAQPAHANASELSQPPPPVREPTIPVVRVEDLPLIIACEGAACDSDPAPVNPPKRERHAPGRR